MILKDDVLNFAIETCMQPKHQYKIAALKNCGLKKNRSYLRSGACGGGGGGGFWEQSNQIVKS